MGINGSGKRSRPIAQATGMRVWAQFKTAVWAS